MKWKQTADALEIDFDGVDTDKNGFVIEAAFE